MNNEELYMKYEHIALAQAGKLWRGYKDALAGRMDLDDLNQTASLSLLKLIPKIDIERSEPEVATYIRKSVKGQLQNEIDRTLKDGFTSIDLNTSSEPSDVHGSCTSDVSFNSVLSDLDEVDRQLAETLSEGGNVYQIGKTLKIGTQEIYWRLGKLRQNFEAWEPVEMP